MQIRYKPTFVRAYKKMPKALKLEVKEKITLFQNPANHYRLRVHKLKGKLKGFYSFSVTHAHRVVFQYEAPDIAVLIAVGDHDVYQ
jgi:addiction module RelE/StbE family toxin